MNIPVPTNGTTIDHESSTIDYRSIPSEAEANEPESDTETLPDVSAQWFHAKAAPAATAWWNVASTMWSELVTSHNYFGRRSANVAEMLPYRGDLEIEFSAELSQHSSVCFAPKGNILVYTVSSEGNVKVGIERDVDTLTPSEIKQHWSLVEAAINKELGSFKDLKVFKHTPVREAVNIMSSRFVIRWKHVGNEKTVKARLCVRGFEDKLANSLSTFASTASRWSQRLVVSACVQNQWSLFSWDISTAFLQGISFQDLAKVTGEPIRKACLKPPAGFEHMFRKIFGISFETHVLEMIKPVYGLKDAPRAWRIALDNVLIRSGGRPLNCDKALYVWFRRDVLAAILSTHVDDLKGGGMTEVVKHIKDCLERDFGPVKVQTAVFEHCGIMHEQSEKGILLHQNHYAAQLHQNDMSGIDISDEDKLLGEKHVALYMSLLGGLAWLVQTRTDIAVYLCSLQRHSKQPQVKHYIRLNQVVKWVRRKKTGLFYGKLTGPLKILMISDSAFKKEGDTGLAMRGALICIAEDRSDSGKQLQPGGKFHVIDFYSRKQRRVTRSTFAAELHSLADGIEVSRLFAMAITECIIPNISSREITRLEELGKLPLLIEAVVDAKSVFDALKVTDTKTPCEASLLNILQQIKELMQTYMVRRLWWVDTGDMLADGLNKGTIGRQALLFACDNSNWLLQKPCCMHQEKVQKIIPQIIEEIQNNG